MTDAPAAKRSKTDCASCSLPRNEHGHSKKYPGWCPVVQKFSTRSTQASERPSYGALLALLNESPVKVSSTYEISQAVPDGKRDLAAQLFVKSILDGDADLVKKQLEPCHQATKCERSSCCRPEFVLMPVDHGTHTWSVLHLAVDCIGLADNEAEEQKAEAVLRALLAHCETLHIHLGESSAERRCPIPEKSDSRSRPLHQAAHIGSKTACDLLIAAGADIFAETRSGWLPVHVACREKALQPAAGDLVPHLIDKMRTKKVDPSYVGYRILPKGFDKHRANRQLLGMEPLLQVSAVSGFAFAGPSCSSDSEPLTLGLSEQPADPADLDQWLAAVDE